VGNLAENLTLLRKDRGYTRQDIAKLINTNWQTYKNWEYGRTEPNISFLIKIATLYQVSIDELVGIKEIRESKLLKKPKKEEKAESK
jgi:transcriptional regulator with XRE-family HTH domain